MADRIDDYLARLRQALCVSAPLREQILGEIEDHLREGAEREEARGLPPEEAQRRVVERFGEPEVVARWWSEVYPREDGGGKMWQRFTERARRVVFYAQEEAARLGENYVGTEHLLLGLVREPDSVAGRLLEAHLGIALAALRLDTELQATRGAGCVGQDMQLTPVAKQMIDFAYEEARSLFNNYIGTEHLLLGLIREPEGLGGRVLRERGADLERTRQAIRALQESESDEALMRGVKAQFTKATLEVTTASPEVQLLVHALNQYDPAQLVATMMPYLRLTDPQRQELQALGSPSDQLKMLRELITSASTVTFPAGGVSLASVEAARPLPDQAPPTGMSGAVGLSALAEGQVHPALVRRITETGAVVEIGTVSTWLPRDEISWPPIRHPSEVLKEGEEIEVMVLQLDRLRGKVVVGLRQLRADEPPEATGGPETTA